MANTPHLKLGIRLRFRGDDMSSSKYTDQLFNDGAFLFVWHNLILQPNNWWLHVYVSYITNRERACPLPPPSGKTEIFKALATPFFFTVTDVTIRTLNGNYFE